jgi:hypothetical protein
MWTADLHRARSATAWPALSYAALSCAVLLVTACSSSARATGAAAPSFRFPDGLPKALQGQNAPRNPWTLTTLVTAAQHSCG